MVSELRNTLLTAGLALTCGFIGAAAWSYSGLADDRTRSYLLENPTILEDLALALRAEQGRERLAELGDELYTPFPGVVIGNPQGSTVLVEFTDYNCPFCEASLADVKRLVAEDPDLMVVVREWPIFEGSDEAARMALAAGLQGKYAAFHEAMFKFGPTTPETIEQAAIAAGLDLERARIDMQSDAVAAEMQKNLSLANALGFSGTPAWVTRNTAAEGAIGYDGLKEALAQTDSL